MFARTFHPDEANQALTTGRLLETGHYAYQAADHHGPTLYYAAAALQKAGGHVTTATLDGTLLRCTPLLFAVLTLVLGFFALRRLTGRTLAGFAAVALLATAPLFVFFATDFIQEMLLAAFLTGMAFTAAEYACGGTPRVKPGSWALGFGIFAGLALATKETATISFAAAVCAGLVLRRMPKIRTTHVVLAALAFALTAVSLFSSFGDHWRGVYDAFVTAPLSYLGRARGADVTAAWHVHPWWKYLQWLCLGHATRDGACHWTCAYGQSALVAQLIVLILPVSFLACFSRLKERISGPLRTAFLFFALYTLFSLVFYSAIPYKTPWCALQILVPLAFLAALGLALCAEMFACLPARVPQRAVRAVFLAILPLVLAATNVPSLVKMFRNPDAPDIPFNYAAASPEVKDLARFVEEAMANPCADPLTAVALPPEDSWPFPWYNRARNDRTGYWTDFAALERLAAQGVKPSCVLVPMAQGHLVQPLFPHLKETKRYYMRPGVRVRVFR